MANSRMTLLFLFGCFVAALAQTSVGTGCTVSASLSVRTTSNSWVDSQGRTNTIYDITVVNDGNCPAVDIGVDFDLPEGGSIVNSWNLQAEAVSTLITGFGPSLATGATFTGAGFVLAAGTSDTPTVTVYGVNCPASCVGSTSAPTSAPSTSAPTSAPSTSAPTSAPSTSAPTSAPTSTPKPIDTNCQVTATQTRRAGSGATWSSGGNNCQIYDLTFTNTGSETVTFAQFDQSFNSVVETVISFWNLEQTCCTQIDSAASYNISLPSSGLAVGAEVTAGFILQYNASFPLTDPEFSTPIVQTQFYNFVVCE